MELKKMSKQEIELMSFTDLTYMLIKENKKAMNTAQLFKKICELLELSDEVQHALLKNKISERHARSLLSIIPVVSFVA